MSSRDCGGSSLLGEAMDRSNCQDSSPHADPGVVCKDSEMSATITYINLEHRIDRREHMESTLRNCPFPWSRLNATRFKCTDVELEKELQKKVPKNIAVSSIWDSHRRAMESLLACDTKYRIVLEDDLNILEEHVDIPLDAGQTKSDFWNDFLNYLETLDFDWDMILVSPRYRPKDTISSGKLVFVPPPDGSGPNDLMRIRSTHLITGAHFCVYRGEGALLRALDELKKAPIIYDVDRFLVDRVRAFGVSVHGVFGGAFGSDHV
ncbi:MAG: hypothetical protein AB7V13_08645 [Pseudorhodoplanes sp.]|uniref:hypothetical protein n=1 Tax=Pseudorhodoplanes sp. TaxID=1934341 RepID=UPI003D0DC24F